MIRRSPLPPRTKPIARGKRPNAKRAKPRKGRVIDRNRMAWAVQKCCQITGEFPATTHHVREFGSPKDDTKIIRLAAHLHMKTAARPGIPCIEDGKELFEKFHGVTIAWLLEDLDYDYYLEESGLGVGWGT